MVTRLRERKSETPEGLKLRIATARQEMKRIDEFDYCVVNAQEKQEETVNTILCIMTAERSKVDQQPVEL
jgi:guanylate kinase